MKKIILASTSPRRKDILEMIGLKFCIIPPECDEDIEISSPENYVKQLSFIKASAVFDQLKKSTGDEGTDALIISADTIVFHNNKILGKPASNEQAFEMLKDLSGDTHAVYSGVTILNAHNGVKTTFYEKTDVTFYDVSDDEIRDYIDTGEPMDKAGAYGIQGKGAFLVKGINGDYYNVVGLPAAHLIRVLKDMDRKYE